VFVCVCSKLSNHISLQQVTTVDPERDPKVDQEPADGGCLTSQNILHLMYGSHILPFWVCSESTSFLHCFSDTVLFVSFSTEKNGAQNGQVF
jgi:hypothetical protein